jgi:hypothetical protein
VSGQPAQTSGWLRRADHVYRAFSTDEIRVLRGLLTGLERTIDDGDPTDAVLLRLAPAAYSDQEAEAQQEFADFTRDRILDGKQQRLRAASADLDHAGLLELDDAGTVRWLQTLGDVRLALAERVGPDLLAGGFGVPNPDPAAEIYDWLGWLQSGLVEVVAAS